MELETAMQSSSADTRATAKALTTAPWPAGCLLPVSPSYRSILLARTRPGSISRWPAAAPFPRPHQCPNGTQPGALSLFKTEHGPPRSFGRVAAVRPQGARNQPQTPSQQDQHHQRVEEAGRLKIDVQVGDHPRTNE